MAAPLQETAPAADADLSGMPLDEYFMENCKIDHSLSVSRPDATLVVSRQTSPSSRSPSRARSGSRSQSRQRNRREHNDSLIVTAPASRDGRPGAISVASSLISFDGLISDGEDDDSPADPRQKDSPGSAPNTVPVSEVLMGGSKRIPATVKKLIKDDSARPAASVSPRSSKHTQEATPPSTAVAATRHSSEWRKQLGISSEPPGKRVIASRVELKMRDWLGKQLRELQRRERDTLEDRSSSTKSDTKKLPTSVKSVNSVERIKLRHRENRIRMGSSSDKSKEAQDGSVGDQGEKNNASRIDSQADTVDPRLPIYKDLFQMFLASAEGKPYHDMFSEYVRLYEAEMAKISALRKSIDDLHIQLKEVNKKSQEKIRLVYKNANEENERLKAELHAVKTEKNVKADLAINRAIAAEEKLLDIQRRNNILEGQRTQLLHVHDILLKYFKMHAKWKSVGEDEDMLTKLGLGGPAAMGRVGTRTREKKKKRRRSKKKAHKKGGIISGVRDEDDIISSMGIGSSLNSNEAAAHPQDSSSEEDSEDSESHVDEIDASIAASAKAADIINEQAAAHEHELAEWKQVHLSLQSLSDAHMAALSDITDLTKTHTEQLAKAHKKIEELERENANLLIAKGPPPSALPNFLAGTSERVPEEQKSVDADTDTKQAEAAGARVGEVGDDDKNGRPRVQKRMSRYERRSLDKSKDEFEGLAPIVVDILLRRPLPALGEDSVIIKRNKGTINVASERKKKKPKRPQPVIRRRHTVLHSHNENSSFAAAKRKKAQQIRARAKLKHAGMR